MSIIRLAAGLPRRRRPVNSTLDITHSSDNAPDIRRDHGNSEESSSCKEGACKEGSTRGDNRKCQRHQA